MDRFLCSRRGPGVWLGPRPVKLPVSRPFQGLFKGQ
jgi:hypothetical protein